MSSPEGKLFVKWLNQRGEEFQGVHKTTGKVIKTETFEMALAFKLNERLKENIY